MTLEEVAAASQAAAAALRAYQDMWNNWREQAKAQVTEYMQDVRREVRRLESLSATVAALDAQLVGMDALIEAMTAPPNLPGTVGSQVVCNATAETIGMPPELRPIAAALQMIVQPRPISGIYFLVRGASVVYVGQSVNVMARVTSHALDKEYDRVFFLKVPTNQLITVEAAFIRMLRPEYNRSCPDDEATPKDHKMVAKLVAKTIAATKKNEPPTSEPTPPVPATPSPSEAA